MPSNEAHSEKKNGQLENHRQFLPVIVEKDGTAARTVPPFFPSYLIFSHSLSHLPGPFHSRRRSKISFCFSLTNSCV